MIDPEAELIETVKSYFAPFDKTNSDSHPQCRYPARYMWLEDELNLPKDQNKRDECDTYNKWANPTSSLYLELVSKHKANIVEGLKLYEESLLDKYNVDIKFPISSFVSVPENRYGAIQETDVKEFHIVEFIDLECGHCRKIHHEIKTLLEKYPDKISIDIRHYPLPSHTHAMQAAQLAWCMNNQHLGGHFVDAVFEFKGNVSEEALVDIVIQQGGQRNRLMAWISEESSFNAIQQDIQIAKEIGVTGTPTLFLNNRFVRSVTDIEKVLKNAR